MKIRNNRIFFASKRVSKIASLIFVASGTLLFAACQDHHWADYDKIGALPDPKRPESSPPPVTTKGAPGVPYDGAGALSGAREEAIEKRKEKKQPRQQHSLEP